MKYGFVIPGGDNIRAIADIAHEIEDAGWDGVFIPDCISIDTPQHPPSPWLDPWITLAAIAMKTDRVRIGTMITPVSRRRPWKLAHEVLSLDHLSNGRIVLPVGLGAAGDDAGFYKVGEAMDLKTRAAILDEGLEIIAGLWRDEPAYFKGEHFTVEGLTLLPKPVQTPSIPIWVVAAWPRPKSMQRAARYDGILPTKMSPEGQHQPLTPDDIRAIRAYVSEHKGEDAPYDIIMEGETPGDDPQKAADTVGPMVEAGATWWLEAMWTDPNWQQNILTRVRQGPPRID
jgi:alkanesulfonate monooxygenase SsuD/methylene tetrahydromethanopterin reductase-like flavin-dependent oxidoreductase (luciferase family)